MPNKGQSALLVHRENYSVPKGQERAVHFKIAKLDGDKIVEPARIVRESPKAFDSSIKRNLELMGYTVEILYHPQNKYSSARIETAEEKMALKDMEIAALKAAAKGKASEAAAEAAVKTKDEEIERLKAEIAGLKAAAKGKNKKEEK